MEEGGREKRDGENGDCRSDKPGDARRKEDKSEEALVASPPLDFALPQRLFSLSPSLFSLFFSRAVLGVAPSSSSFSPLSLRGPHSKEEEGEQVASDSELFPFNIGVGASEKEKRVSFSPSPRIFRFRF